MNVSTSDVGDENTSCYVETLDRISSDCRHYVLKSRILKTELSASC